MFSRTFLLPILTVGVLVLFPNCGIGESLSPNPFWNRDDTIVSDPTVKPGGCPASDPRLYCDKPINECKTDCECPQNKKCCFQENNCGYLCREPTISYNVTCGAEIAKPTKKGDCPSIQTTTAIACKRCVDECRADCECPGTMRCCPGPKGCGNRCQNVTVKPEPQPEPVPAPVE